MMCCTNESGPAGDEATLVPVTAGQALRTLLALAVGLPVSASAQQQQHEVNAAPDYLASHTLLASNQRYRLLAVFLI